MSVTLYFHLKYFFVRNKEIIEWKDLIEDCIRDVKNEMQRLNYEKELCSRDLQNLNPKFTMINECITLRSGRVKTDLCLDPVDTELDKVLFQFD